MIALSILAIAAVFVTSTDPGCITAEGTTWNHLDCADGECYGTTGTTWSYNCYDHELCTPQNCCQIGESNGIVVQEWEEYWPGYCSTTANCSLKPMQYEYGTAVDCVCQDD